MVKLRPLSAGYGAKSWLYKRLTAVLMLVSLFFLVAFIIVAHLQLDSGIVSWQNFFKLSLVKVVTQLTIIALAIHAWVGMRDLWMDYIKCSGIRIVFYTLTVLWLSGSVVYAALILWARG